MGEDVRGLADEIRAALNRYSAENGSNTPDFILARYLLACLSAYDEAVTARAAWYDGHSAPVPPDRPEVRLGVGRLRAEYERLKGQYGRPGWESLTQDHLNGFEAALDILDAAGG